MSDDNRRLDGRRILITGAASGIGAATARLFASHGARLALLDQNGENLNRVAGECGGYAVVADVTDGAAVIAAVDRAADELGGLDGLVNSAGIAPAARFEATDEATWARTLDVNLTGPFRVCQAALGHLQAAESATVVTISSAIGLTPIPNRAAYAASKSGVLALSKVMAMELAPSIRVNVVCPGPIDTPLVRNEFDDETLATLPARHALNRLGQADEVAATILFLTSSESSFTTGAAITVDGGRTFH
ncbi:MAG: NAD(P)-dependent dehydrogenase (short-subunit alcohol dehydrogenase family) [Myxococcota bacterium]|jgi:NAD(P)-dependent dehydrogenase (short-subunit alcohol dehydrogenase family)